MTAYLHKYTVIMLSMAMGNADFWAYKIAPGRKGSRMIRIIIVDNEPAVRKGLRLLLGAETDMEVVGEAGDGPDALLLCQALSPDVALLDVQMPHMDGLAVAEALRVTCPATHVFLLTFHDDARTRAQAAEAGAGLISKQAAPGETLSAIRSVAC